MPRAPGLTGCHFRQRRCLQAQGAVSDAFRCGLLAGLFAGATAVLAYSMHCTEDDPAFYGIWHTVGVTVSMLMGGLIGKRVLRW